jgi:hypothetical protein
MATIIKLYRFLAYAPWLLWLPLVCGCQKPNAYTLAGVVKVGDRVPDQGSILLEPVQGGKTLGATLNQGAFQISNVPAGEAKVRFTVTKKTGTTRLAADGPTVDQYVSILPERYRDGIILNIVGDQLDLTFDLQASFPPK